jgi:hypothetical protein
MDKLNFIRNSISLLADVMTIIGITGITSWSLFSKDREPFQDKVAGIFAYSLKSAFCLILFIVLLGASKLVLEFFVVLVNGHISFDTQYWNAAEPLGYVIGYLVLLLVMLPVFLVISVTIYTWSLHPFRRVKSAFRQRPT